MTTPHQTLIKQITDEAQSLPDNLVREVLDFIGYLRTKYDQNDVEAQQKALLSTFGSWKDDREAEQIVQDIYATRTISELEPGL
jgi:histidine ammonia-lyase